MFWASSAHLQDSVVYMQHMVLSLSMRVLGGLSVHSLSENSSCVLTGHHSSLQQSSWKNSCNIQTFCPCIKKRCCDNWCTLTHCMEHSPSWEANWFAASQGIPHILWNPKVHYRHHKCLPPFPIQSSSPCLRLTVWMSCNVFYKAEVWFCLIYSNTQMENINLIWVTTALGVNT